MNEDFIIAIGKDGMSMRFFSSNLSEHHYEGNDIECFFFGVSTEKHTNNDIITGRDVSKVFVDSDYVKALKRLSGEFALVVLFKNKQRVMLATDNFASFHLFLSRDPRTSDILVSNRLSLIVKELEKLTINHPAIIEYLQLGTITPPDTAYKEVLSIVPGTAVVLTPAEIAFTEVSDIVVNKSHDLKSLVNSFRMSFEEAIRLRVVHRNKVGVFLSGGIDSAAILALATKFLGRDKVEAYTIGPWGKESSELPFARISADYSSVNLHVEYGDKNLLNELDKILDLMAQPNADSGVLASYRLSKKAADNNCEVLLNGQNADTIFGAIPYVQTMRKWWRLQKYLFAREFVRAACKLLDQRRRYKVLFVCESNPIKAFLFKKTGHFLGGVYEFVNPEQEKHFLLNKVMERFQKRMSSEVGDLVILIDLLMTESRRCLEAIKAPSFLPVRMPYYDDRVVEAALQVPDQLRTVNSTDKYVLRLAFEGLVHNSILNRKPKSLVFPLHLWLDDAELYENLKGDEFVSQMVDFGKLKKLRTVLKPNGWAHILYKLWVLKLWHSKYAERKCA